MKAPAKKSKRSSKAKKLKKQVTALDTCPINGEGWCPYPFSLEQLQKRLKNKEAAKAEIKPVLAAANSR